MMSNIETEEKTVKERCLKPEIANHNLCPFKLQWSFGINPEVPIINLTTKNRTLIAYACSHVAMIYDYSSKIMLPLQGHRNVVKTLSTTWDGKWLLTADFEKDCVIVIWNTEERTPVCTLFNPHGNEGMTAARIAPNAKQIVTVGNEKCQIVHLWLWTYGRKKPDASIPLVDTLSERVKEIVFNNEYPEQFALTTDYHVLFLTWHGHTINYDCPKVVMKFRRVGIFNGSCYVPKIQQVYTATTNGCVLVWCNNSHDKEHIVDNEKKKHLKTVHLHNSSITVITDNEGMLVIGTLNGRISFYDYQLKLLYWCQSCDLTSIRWISFNLPSDLLASSFVINICDSSFTGLIALIEIPKQKCHLILCNPNAIVTCLDTHPESDYIAVGDAQGAVHLYNHEKRILVISKNIPSLSDFRSIFEEQMFHNSNIYVTCPQINDLLKGVTALKFSSRCDMLVCGVENGAIWILHHITLDILNKIPYKHSLTAINKIIFTQCADYMAYIDNGQSVVVFKRNNITLSKKDNIWELIGKYHSHHLPIRDILFGPAISDSQVPRFFSLGEDRELVEYDLQYSGPYPIPGLKILQINRLEENAVPLCLAWYPKFGTERFLMVSNSEYKYKIFDNITKTIHGTYLGPIYGKPVQHFQVLTEKLVNNNVYMVFATNKEIGLQILPIDGNPYKIIGMTGHPRKIIGIAVSSNKRNIFTIGYNDSCVLMWEIIFSSVDLMAQLGGEGLLPFYRLIQGKSNGWLINEMKDLFYYAQILRQGEYTTAPRIVSDTVAVKQIPDLMRAIGYFPSNKEIENIMEEVRYKCYSKTNELTEEISFEEFVRLYVNHRPVFGISTQQTKEAFYTFIEKNSNDIDNVSIKREQFKEILLGSTSSKTSLENLKPRGEPLTLEETDTYLKLLTGFNHKQSVEITDPSPSHRSMSLFPSSISYKDFAMDIIGIEVPGEVKINN